MARAYPPCKSQAETTWKLPPPLTASLLIDDATLLKQAIQDDHEARLW